MGELYDLSLDKDMFVADMLVEEEGDKKIIWRWRRRLFQWEEEMVEVCRVLVLGVERKEEEEDRWQWGGECYTVKNTYISLIEGESEELNWTKEADVVMLKLKITYFLIVLFFRWHGERL
ncbi:receptor-like protein kinase ANXUR2 [Trifolium medium]|uniref:Receptor-like protein kinase ANXUR2 n=1 Tax=Trifolium medium TaxID=97028 RepID=A0A392NSG3_9FABA|nr:receptor-like protein kinase ANXUR2 [Trifolium medium]